MNVGLALLAFGCAGFGALVGYTGSGHAFGEHSSGRLLSGLVGSVVLVGIGFAIWSTLGDFFSWSSFWGTLAGYGIGSAFGHSVINRQ